MGYFKLTLVFCIVSGIESDMRYLKVLNVENRFELYVSSSIYNGSINEAGSNFRYPYKTNYSKPPNLKKPKEWKSIGQNKS